ncbi:hypothetical protein [Sphingomonas jeddahensis]|uniref:Terminase small subunit n=1 Tax=Sphingomonas jeddahensis TaxID=1915074 RepID=A0A1V2EQW0_9SPHN|nr:hypothetical protein [Sphingomonas jeddahensis]ONF94980.1 hypothetical protein SPHI_28220 [Sphingomonas jeddahensis]
MATGMATASGGRVAVCARTQGRRNRFLAVLAETCSVALAARMAKRTMATCYRWRSEDAAFAAAWDAAIADGYARLEAGLLEHALAKVERGGEAPGSREGSRGGSSGVSFAGGDPAVLPVRAASAADLQFAMAVLLRRRADGKSGKAVPKGMTMPTPAETDAALRRALDGLARQAGAA